MKICFLSCGIYQPELAAVLSEIRTEGLFDCELAVIYLPAKLHSDFKLLKAGILKALSGIVADRIILLYGSKCHPEFYDFLQDYQLVRFGQSNCIELILGERMREIDRVTKTIYLTPGWVINWQKFFDPKKGSDETAIKQSFASFEQLLFVDTGVCEVDAKKIREISLYTGLPIKVEKIGLGVFKSNILTAIGQALHC
jgi:hypothetical protein